MSHENILYAVEDGVARVTINRPDKLNALNNQTLTELASAFDAAGDDGDVRAVRVFCPSGENLKSDT